MPGTSDSGANVVDLPRRTGALAADDGTEPSGRRARHVVFAALVADHDERLRTLAYQLLGSRDSMDDVLQDVYVKAYRALPSFRGDAALSTWLYRITYTTCMDRLRRIRGLEQLPMEVAERPDEESALEDAVVRGDELRRALALLDADHRAAVLLVLRDGHSYEAAATILDVPRGTVASRVARARRLLARSLSPSGEGGPS